VGEFLPVPDYRGSPGTKAVKWLLLLIAFNNKNNISNNVDAN